jgi:hypothetical protein
LELDADVSEVINISDENMRRGHGLSVSRRIYPAECQMNGFMRNLMTKRSTQINDDEPDAGALNDVSIALAWPNVEIADE